MKAAWYEKQGPAAQVLILGEMSDPQPEQGDVRIRLVASGVNPGDIKKRQDALGVGMPFPRVIPHSDGAGTIDRVGEGVPASRVGERVWCFGAQSYRPFGTAAEYVVLPSARVVPLSARVSFEQGACLGIPGITAHRAVHVAGPVEGSTVLVQGGAGAVGLCAVALARHAGAHVIATVRSEQDELVAEQAGAHEVVRIDGLSVDEMVERVATLAPDGVHHVVEVAYHANIAVDEAVLAMGGSIATYATGNPSPPIPFWPLVFKNVRVFFLGSDDFPDEAKRVAAAGLNEALDGEWPGFQVSERLSLRSIVEAHECLEARRGVGRVVVIV
ncbi:MAG: NADPH:quinone reductase [Gemmatimonadetes bacterium]|nr:NADPH:quinone reductase [Gemmatimonadota bacterium]MCK5488723.1 NADPH:quinone reductase [Gemmatimonadota bacterium]